MNVSYGWLRHFPTSTVTSHLRAPRTNDGKRAAVRYKMADGLCSVETDCSVNEKTINYETVIDRENPDRMNDVSCENVKSYLIASDSEKLFNNLCEKSSNVNVVNKFLERPCSPSDEDCRKKRCVDRYDSSESSDRFVRFLLNHARCTGRPSRNS